MDQATAEAQPYNWVIAQTTGGYSGKRRQAAGMVEQFGETLPVLMARITAYEAQVKLPLSSQLVYDSLGWGEGGFGQNGWGGAVGPENVGIGTA